MNYTITISPIVTSSVLSFNQSVEGLHGQSVVVLMTKWIKLSIQLGICRTSLNSGLYLINQPKKNYI